MADIRNAYLQSPTSQKHYIICGPKFGMENVGKVAIMHRAVYGGKQVEEILDTIFNHVTEVCHLGHFWLSYGRCVMSGSPNGLLVGPSR